MKKTLLKLALCLGLCVALCATGFIGACGDSDVDVLDPTIPVTGDDPDTPEPDNTYTDNTDTGNNNTDPSDTSNSGNNDTDTSDSTNSNNGDTDTSDTASGDNTDSETADEDEGRDANIFDYFTFQKGLSNTYSYEGSYTLAFYTDNYGSDDELSLYEAIAYDENTGHMTAVNGSRYYYYDKTDEGLTRYQKTSTRGSYDSGSHSYIYTDSYSSAEYEVESSMYSAYDIRTSFSYVAESLLYDPATILSEDSLDDYIAQEAFIFDEGIAYFSSADISVSVQSDDDITVYTVHGKAIEEYMRNYMSRWVFEAQIFFASNYLTEVRCNVTCQEFSFYGPISGLISGNVNSASEEEVVYVDAVISYDFDSSLWPESFDAWNTDAEA
ncbi:MAG: hypothetical protein LUE27_11405 [Clostridia bacterium]|nr:hypothetical protein [Clostridia bacterium]